MMEKIFSIIILTVIAFLLAGCTSTAQNPEDAGVCGIKGPCTETSENNIKISVSEVTSTMKTYTYDAKGVEVSYFAVRGSDGAIRTAFDACDVCGGYKGYVQRGDDVMCNNCGRFFSIDDIGTKNRPGGCWPSFLDHQIDGDTLLISKSDLEAGAYRFA